MIQLTSGSGSRVQPRLRHHCWLQAQPVKDVHLGRSHETQFGRPCLELPFLWLQLAVGFE